MNVIKFNKTLEHRMKEYNEVFGDFVNSSSLKKKWRLYLESLVDHKEWKALWKIPRITCESFNISFPTLVLVRVLCIDFKNLSGFVIIIGVQDDFDDSVPMPERHNVSLLHLWPTQIQDLDMDLDINSTANALDVFRFFYLHLHLPWDDDEDDTVNWKSEHLESRLRFYYNLKSGSIPRFAAHHIHSLLTEVRSLQREREILGVEIEENEENDKEIKNKLEHIMEIYGRQLEIRSQLEIYEKPELREVILKRNPQLLSAFKNREQLIWIVCEETTADNYIIFLQKIKQLYPTETFLFCSSLATQLHIANDRDIFLLNESDYLIHSTGALETGGVLKGIGSKDSIVLSSTADVVFDFIGGTVLIENITINVSSTQRAILVRKGKCILKNCIILDAEKSLSQLGIIILEGAELQVINCQISGFTSAIKGNPNSVISLENCNIHSSVNGVWFFDSCTVNMKNSCFHDCQKYGITVETEEFDHGSGHFDILKRISAVSFEELSGERNLLGDVNICRKQEPAEIIDFLSNSDSSPALTETEDETM